MRVAFHAINGIGLGHLVRAICLASEIRELEPASKLLVLTNARDTSLLREAALDYVKLPPRLGEPHADPARVCEALSEPVEEAVLAATLDAFRPELVVFDTHAPLAVVAHATRLGARTVLVLRELRPEAMRALRASKAALAFDRIVVPHEHGETDLGALADLAHAVVGPIVRPARRAEGAGAGLLAIAGGGGQPVDARRYVQAVADAHALARLRLPDLVTTLVTGPYGEGPPNAASYAGLEVVRAAPDLPSLLARASLVVSQAGYNAVAELRSLRKPAILVPAYRKAEDQRQRARRLARVGAAVIARPEARAIADQIEALLGSPARLAAMAAAHDRCPLVAQNRAAAKALLRTIRGGARAERVAIVAHDFAPKLGGMETVARALAKSLLDAGVEVRVYTTSRLGARSASGLGEAVVRPLYRPRPRPLRIDLLADLLTTIDAALVDQPDVIHLCHAGLGPWVPALRAALPSAVTINVHGNDLLAPWVHHGSEPAAYRAAQIAGIAAADAVIAVSRFSADLARSLGIAGKVTVIENGVDPERFTPTPAPDDAAVAARLGLAPEDEIVLTVSRLAPRKGHRTALRAIAELARRRPRLRYVFTGASEVMRAELGALADELGVASRVHGVGFVPDADLPALYRAAKVFVLLAESAAEDDVEGFGVALLEAAASGVPAVASRTGGVPEALVDGEMGLLVEPGDAAAAARAIERLLEDTTLARACATRGRLRVTSSLTDAHAAARVRELWARALGRAPASGLGSYIAQAYPERPTNGAELARLAREDAERRREVRAARRADFAKLAQSGVVRLRATGDGARILPEALDDCVALGIAPLLEVKLSRFVDEDFQRFALPHVAVVDLAHGVPHRDAPILDRLVRELPPASTRKLGTVRLFLTPEARADGRIAVSAVPQAHALRRFFAGRGVVVVPPPELMRYLSDVPAGGPETGMIEPTNLCNLECPTCPTGVGKIPPLPAMPLARFEHVIGELAPRMRNLALWNYGEPLLNKELPKMIAHAKAAGVKVVKVSSNVHFLDGPRGEALLGSGLDVLILSVDGASQDTYLKFRKAGDFATVARTVAWLCAEKKRRGLKNPRIELQFIVMRHNEHELPEMRRLARAWGVDALRVKTVGAEDEATKHLVPTSRLLSRYREDRATPNVRHALCTMPWDHTVVNVDGSVTPCCYLRPDMGEAFIMGNVFERSFTEIWRGEKYRAFRQAMLEGRGSLPVCDRCRGGTHDLVAATEEVG